MKVVSALQRLCKDCFIVRRGKRLYMRCKSHPRHKRRQGFATLNYFQNAQVEDSENTPIRKSYDGFYLDSING